MAYTVYDDAGRATASWRVGTDGFTTLKQVTVYYTAATNADAADGSRCGNRPEWAGQPCVTRQEGTLTGADPARMTTALPTRYVAGYTTTGEPEFVAETVGGNTGRPPVRIPSSPPPATFGSR